MVRLIISVLSISNVVFAANTDLWSNSRGVIEASICETVYVAKSPLKILKNDSSKMVQLRAIDANYSYVSHSGSLVKTLKVNSLDSSIEILTYQGKQALDGNLLGKRGTKGIVSNSSLIDIKNKLLSVEGEAHRLLSDKYQVEHIKLQIAHNESGFKIVKCKFEVNEAPKTYVVFIVRDVKTLGAVSEIGIELDNSTLLLATHYNSDLFRDDVVLPNFGIDGINIFSYVVCSEAETVRVYGDDYSLVLFKSNKGEEIVPFQSFNGATTKNLATKGEEAKVFQKVKFSDQVQGLNIGWIASEYVKLASECPYLKEPEDIDGIEPDPVETYTFPTTMKPTHPYDSGMRRFGARRGNGRRLHAANDIYREKNDAVVAVQGGVVIRALYPFYQGTFAIEVKHVSGKVVRYGELTGNKPAGKKLSVGARVSKKDILGFIGKVNSGCCNPMLHFEMYSGKGSGRLSNSSDGSLYNRRWDLLDPTSFLKSWEKLSSWN